MSFKIIDTKRLAEHLSGYLNAIGCHVPPAQEFAHILGEFPEAELPSNSTLNAAFATITHGNVFGHIMDAMSDKTDTVETDISKYRQSTVPMPKDADPAELMAKVGMKWLEDNGPERIKKLLIDDETLKMAREVCDMILDDDCHIIDRARVRQLRARLPNGGIKTKEQG